MQRSRKLLSAHPPDRLPVAGQLVDKRDSRRPRLPVVADPACVRQPADPTSLPLGRPRPFPSPVAAEAPEGLPDGSAHSSRLELERFRKFERPVRVSGFSAALNLLCGPNEFGKSTILAALQLRAWLDAGGTRAPIRVALVRYWVRRGGSGWRSTSPDRARSQTRRATATSCSGTWSRAGPPRGRRRPAGATRRAPARRRRARRRAVGLGHHACRRGRHVRDGRDRTPRCARPRRRGRRGDAPFGGAALRAERHGPVRNVTTAPRRPIPGRGRGRPPLATGEELLENGPPPLSPISRFERPEIDYGALEAAIAECERVIRTTKRSLDLPQTGTRPAALEAATMPGEPVRGVPSIDPVSQSARADTPDAGKIPG